MFEKLQAKVDTYGRKWRSHEHVEAVLWGSGNIPTVEDVSLKLKQMKIRATL